jgi:VWFA-related protein
MRSAARLLAVAALFCLTTPLSAQSVPRVDETVDVSIVNVDVVVTDRAGNRIRGLTSADFELRDDGRVVPLSNFAEYSSEDEAGRATATGESSPARAIAPMDRRTVVIFIERFSMPNAQTDRFFAELKKMLQSIIREGDAAAIVTWNYVMKVRQNFTNDHAALDRALDAVAADMARQSLDVETELLRAAFNQEMLDRASMEQSIAPVPSAINDGRERARHALVDIRRKAVALTTLIDTMAASPGRRILFMATRRFSQFAGAEFFGGDVPQQHRADFDTAAIRKEVAESANAAGVTVYPLYPEGAEQVVMASVEEGSRVEGIVVGGRVVRRDNDRWRKDAEKASRSGVVLMNETAAIGELATQTGGVAGWGKTDIVRLAEAIRNDSTFYYSLAIRAPESDGRPHRISVTTKNGAYRVRSRREYVVKTDSARMRDRVRTALYSSIEPPSLDFVVETGQPRRAARRYRVPVIIRIPVSSLTTVPRDGVQAGSFGVFAAAGGMLGIMSDVTEKSQPFTVKPEDVQKAESAFITYELEVVADGRADRISIGVLDDTSKQWGVVTVKLDKEGARAGKS